MKHLQATGNGTGDEMIAYLEKKQKELRSAYSKASASSLRL
jgi:hypothetical protein